MILPPNSTWDIYRTQQDDGYGDTEDDNSDPPLYTGIRGLLSYQNRRVMDPVTRTPQQVQIYFLLLPQGTDARNDDRLRCQETGETFNASGITALPSFGFTNDVSVTLTKVGG
jgi:hypothetical protein